ncbi:MAG: TolC family protein, partial [Myxococcota bacterium]
MRLGLGGLLLVCSLAVSGNAYGKSIRVGLIADVQEPAQLGRIADELAASINQTLGTRHAIQIAPTDRLSSRAHDASEAYQRLSARCDLLIVIGPSSLASVPATPEKPTFGLGVVSAELQGLPLQPDGSSGNPRFTYVLTARNLGGELERAFALRPFKHLALLVEPGSAEHLGASEGRVQELEKRIGAKITSVEVGTKLPELPAGVDTAYLALGLSRGDAELTVLAQELADARIPSFTAQPSQVRRGVMASFARDDARAQVVRKLSVMIDDHLSGESLAEMNVMVRRERQLLLNSQTMRTVGFSPPFETLYSAEVIVGNSSSGAPQLKLVDVVEAALENSFDVELARTDIRTLELDYLTALSFFLPAVGSSLGYTQFDEGRSNPINPEQSLIANVTVEQLLFSQSLIAGIQLQSILTDAQKFATQRQIFDVLANVFEAYFAVLGEQAVLEVQTENLSVTRENLEIARLQQRLGSSSAADVYRFEAEVASAQQAVVEAQLNYRVATQQLNLLTGYALPPLFDVEDIDADHALFIKTFNGPIGSRLSDRESIRRFAGQLIEESLRNFPGKKELVATGRALKRQRSSNVQAYFLPDLALVAQGGQPLWLGGIGAPDTDDYDQQWNVTLQLSYPISVEDRV